MNETTIQRHKQLKNIWRMTLQYKQVSLFKSAVIPGVLGCCAFVFLNYARPYLPLSHSQFVLCAMAAVIPVALAFTNLIAYEPKPSFATILEALANYDPLDKEGYRRLQQDAAELEKRPKAIIDWLRSERSAVDNQEPSEIKKIEDARERFEKKTF